MRTAIDPRRGAGPPEQGVHGSGNGRENGNGVGGANNDPGLHNYVERLHGNGDSSNPSSSDESGRLSVIMENGDTNPPSPTKPPRVSHRPFPRLLFGSDPPLHDHDHSPPPYSLADVIGPKGEKLLDLRNKRQVARRGGWKRLAVLAVVLIALIVGLTVGLVVGLRNRHKSTTADDIPPPPASSATPYPSGPFPVGSYSITTFLTTVNTNCTSNPSTWRCYPYSTYAQSPTLSMATFDWIIAANASSSGKYSISSSEDPFALSFASVPLELQSQGLDYEHYSFSVPMNKVVIPTGSLTSGGLDTCYFNGTTLFASLYTKQQKNITSPSASPTASGTASASAPSGAFSPYPYAVDIQQTISGSASVPACYATDNGNPTGAQITKGVNGPTAQCGCVYQNFSP